MKYSKETVGQLHSRFSSHSSRGSSVGGDDGSSVGGVGNVGGVRRGWSADDHFSSAVGSPSRLPSLGGAESSAYGGGSDRDKRFALPIDLSADRFKVKEDKGQKRENSNLEISILDDMASNQDFLSVIKETLKEGDGDEFERVMVVPSAAGGNYEVSNQFLKHFSQVRMTFQHLHY